MVFPLTPAWTGGDPEDDESDYVRACEAYTGLGGKVPPEFATLDVAEEWGCSPMAVEEAPAFWVEMAMFRRRVLNQAEADRAANQDALTAAYLAAQRRH